MSKLQIVLAVTGVAVLLNGCASTSSDGSASESQRGGESPVRDLVIPPLPGLGATPIVTRNSG